MKTKEKAKAYDEAVEQAKKELNTCGSLDCDAARQIFRFFPQLRIDHDEWIRQYLIDELKATKSIEALKFLIPQPTREECIAYLEMQKESTWTEEDENFRKHILPRILNPKGWSMELIDADKERLKLFIERQKIKWVKKQKEQNGEDEECADFTIYHPLKNEKGKYECIPYSFYGSLTSFSGNKDLIYFLRTCFYTKEECNEWIEQQKERKLTLNWRTIEQATTKRTDEGDCVTTERMLIKGSIDDEDYRIIDKNVMVNKNLLCIPISELNAKEQKPSEWSEEDEKLLNYAISLTDDAQVKRFLESLRPSWKPSEEQMDALAYAIQVLAPRATKASEELENLREQLKKTDSDMNTWWVEYEYTYDLWCYDEDDNGGWEVCEDSDARRFRCVKKDIPKMVKEHIEEELKYDTIRNLKVNITDKYITTDCEV